MHPMAQIDSGCDPTTMRASQRLYGDPTVRFHPNFDPTTIIVFQLQNEIPTNFLAFLFFYK